MTETVKMKCLIGTIGLEFSQYSYGEIFEVEERLAQDFERDRIAERVIEAEKPKEPEKEPKKRGKNPS